MEKPLSNPKGALRIIGHVLIELKLNCYHTEGKRITVAVYSVSLKLET